MYMSTTGALGHLELRRVWLQECLEKHPQCGSNRNRFVPNRSVRIQYPNTSRGLTVKLSRDRSTSATYCALSYRLGDTQVLLLKMGNPDQWEQELPFNRLLKAIREAIEVTHCLR